MSVFQVQFKLALKTPSQRELWLWGTAMALMIAAIILIGFFFWHYQNRFYKGIYIDNHDLGGLTRQQAQSLLSSETQPPSFTNEVVIWSITTDERTASVSSSLNELIQDANLEGLLTETFELGRKGNIISRLARIIQLLIREERFHINYPVNNALLKEALTELAQNVNDPGIKPSITQPQPNSAVIEIETGKNGLELQIEESVKIISQELYNIINSKPKSGATIELQALTTIIEQELNEDQLKIVKQRAERLVGKKLTITHFSKPKEGLQNDKELEQILKKHNKLVIDQVLVSWISPWGGYQKDLIAEFVGALAQEIDQEPINAVFELDEHQHKVLAFSPHQSGIRLNQDQLEKDILITLETIETTNSKEPINTDGQNQTSTFEISALIEHIDPEVTLGSTNKLGINELLGFGESFYAGSIPSRIHNVKRASDRLNFTLVAPGQEFSFNKTVGTVDGNTGFQQAYVIRAGRTLMEFGGGVCQVSTTAFRAMLDAGVNITKRLPHSYRVRYYELNNQPGFDATVYSGEVDLRFINDTPGYLLLVSEAESAKAHMTVKIYGTNDGRRSEISGYRQWDYAAPPPSQDIHDPNLAPGERVQVENAIPGLKTSFNWTVYRSGEVLHQKTFFSHYRAWGAKFMVGI